MISLRRIGRLRYAAPIALGLAAAIAATPALARTQTYSKSASAGKSKKIDSYFGWKNDCSFETIDVKIVKPPKSGSVTPRVEMSRISAAQLGSAGKCLGKPTRALSVYYRSKAGFKGQDSFSVRMSVGGQSVDFVYNVSVR